MLISSPNTPTHIRKQYFTTLVQSCWYIGLTMTVLKEHSVWRGWEIMVDRINSVMEVSTESKHRSNLGFLGKVTPNLDLIWKDRFGIKRQMLGLRGKRMTCRLKEQKKQKLEDKIRMEKEAGARLWLHSSFQLYVLSGTFFPALSSTPGKSWWLIHTGFLPVKWRRKSISKEQT